MEAIDELKKKHQGIELMLRVLQAVANKFERGEQVYAEHLDGILEFLSIFVDKCHHGKEEDFMLLIVKNGKKRFGSTETSCTCPSIFPQTGLWNFG
jgi:hemerythrin-like domain-containing protein